ncbi:MAG: shikimate kinase [Actinomycetota bacterium]|nr:shikimate kinase [Acidimicrobiia bacterium]MDQ3294820.1 shikimate kinase [Actinomycetota bacterium]
MTPGSGRHVVLVGMMGSGKTTVGRRVAKVLGRPFVDADEAFIARFGRTVAAAFADDGEDGFRALEAELLAELIDVPDPLVIATGGGVVVREENRKRLADPDVFVVLLHAEPAFLASRTTEAAHRPLLADGDLAAVLQRLHDERIGWYQEVADEVLEVASFHEWGSSPKRAMAARIAARVGEPT